MGLGCVDLGCVGWGCVGLGCVGWVAWAWVAWAWVAWNWITRAEVAGVEHDGAVRLLLPLIVAEVQIDKTTCWSR